MSRALLIALAGQTILVRLSKQNDKVEQRFRDLQSCSKTSGRYDPEIIKPLWYRWSCGFAFSGATAPLLGLYASSDHSGLTPPCKLCWRILLFQPDTIERNDIDLATYIRSRRKHD